MCAQDDPINLCCILTKWSCSNYATCTQNGFITILLHAQKMKNVTESYSDFLRCWICRSHQVVSPIIISMQGMTGVIHNQPWKTRVMREDLHSICMKLQQNLKPQPTFLEIMEILDNAIFLLFSLLPSCPLNQYTANDGSMVSFRRREEAALPETGNWETKQETIQILLGVYLPTLTHLGQPMRQH